MNGHQQTHNPYAQNILFTHNRDGTPAPAGLAFNVIGQLVPLPYQPWMFGPQQAWESLYNDPYVALQNSDASIEPQPSADPGLPMRWGKDPLGRAVPPITHEHVALVPNYEYINREDPDQPTQDLGSLALTGIGATGTPARINYRRSKSLVGYTMVPSPDLEFALALKDRSQPTPLGVLPIQTSIAEPPVGGCVSVIQMSMGHKGNQFDFVIDVPAGQIVQVPFGASFGATRSFLTPKYFNREADATIEPDGFRFYILFPGGPPLTTPPGPSAGPPNISGSSAIWNSMTADILPRNGFPNLSPPMYDGNGTLISGNPNTTPFLGWFAESWGSFRNTSQTQAIRRFYGTVPCSAVIANPLSNPVVNAENIVVCPVAQNAKTVKLLAAPGLSFVVRGNSAFSFYGPFPANMDIDLPQNATSILVYATSDLSQPGNPVIEEFFELEYKLSF